MRFIIASDTDSVLIEYMSQYLSKLNHNVLVIPSGPWAKIAQDASLHIIKKEADEAIVACYTGTGVCMAANKIKGIRAALCVDAQTAEGAKKWNNANVLALSLRLLSPYLVDEILSSWLNTSYANTEDESLSLLLTGHLIKNRTT
jgi:ribose 5-phosphate isomerase B